MRLPANTATQGFLMLLWLIASSTELLHFRSAYQRCRGIRLDAEGNLSICGAADRWQPAVLLPASVVLAGQAWLRIRLPDGLEYAEWLTGNPRQSQQWRRFQVIWRHL
ncbi:MAG: hypothetical protein KJO82_14810 [Gammaproteobacteria bacterium]|nr:hypothetical protein [Gammaproteobacteria bacterium]